MLKACSKTLVSADDIVVKTYYKCPCQMFGNIRIMNIIVTDISNIADIDGGTVMFKSGENDVASSVFKELLKELINFCYGYSD